jgi:hypothetical protein
MLARHQRRPRDALQHLNHARKDGVWGMRAVLAMVDVCISPDNSCAWQVRWGGGGMGCVHQPRQQL